MFLSPSLSLAGVCLSYLMVCSLSSPLPEDKGIVKTGLDALNNLVSNTVKSSADHLCTSGQSTGGLIRDSCERISVLQYCDTTYGWDRRCRFKGWAWAIFIGVPVLAVIIIAGLVLYCTRKKSTTA